jgi:hypothetical protein
MAGRLRVGEWGRPGQIWRGGGCSLEGGSDGSPCIFKRMLTIPRARLAASATGAPLWWRG